MGRRKRSFPGELACSRPELKEGEMGFRFKGDEGYLLPFLGTVPLTQDMSVTSLVIFVSLELKRSPAILSTSQIRLLWSPHIHSALILHLF